MLLVQDLGHLTLNLRTMYPAISAKNLSSFEKNISDRGSEFKKEVKIFCSRWKIRRTCSCVYHPQLQSKVERSHRDLRNKIHYGMVKLNSKGVNWIKSLPPYGTILNEGAREKLGWKSPFKIHYGRKSNAILNKQIESLSNNKTRVAKTSYPKKKI